MIKRIKLLLLAPFLLVTFGLTPSLVAADCSNPSTPAEAIRCGTNSAAGVPVGNNPGGKLTTTIGKIVNLISVVVGIAAVIMIMVAGVKFVSSGGKEDSIKSAKSTVVYALVGLVVVALAQVIVRFVLNKTIQP